MRLLIRKASKPLVPVKIAVLMVAKKFQGIKGMGVDNVRDKYLKELEDVKLIEVLGSNHRATKYRIIR